MYSLKRHRYSYWHKIIPLVLVGYSDEVDELRVAAKALFEQAGAQYVKENESDFKDFLDFTPDNPLQDRPSIGCRWLVYRNMSKILPALMHDAVDWTVQARKQAVHLLYHMLTHVEDNMTMHMQQLIQTLLKVVADEDREIAVMVGCLFLCEPGCVGMRCIGLGLRRLGLDCCRCYSCMQLSWHCLKARVLSCVL